MSNMWGFDLDMTAVRLMRRDTGDWQEVAAEKIEGADIEERLMALVDRIDSDASVELFLPRDQILYTEVALQSGEEPQAQIERALIETTPYPLDELDFDWELSDPSNARVAAIALETLDEAVAFAEVRGVKVGGFSSFADDADFPRMPAFKGHSILRIEEDVEPDEPVTFSSARTPSKPRPDAGTLAPVAPEAQPIIMVDDDAPVMRIKAPTSLPLDPGVPIEGPATSPRVRTDIASAVVSEQVASLTPPSVKVRRSGPAFWKIGAVFFLALLLTIGVATLVWRYVPLGPGDAPVPVTEETGAEAETPIQTDEPVEIVTPEPEPVIVPEPVIEPEPEVQVAEEPVVPDLPQPVVFDIPDVTTMPLPDDTVDLVIGDGAPVVRTTLNALQQALRSGEGLPFVDLGLPVEPTPERLAATLTEAPLVEVLSTEPIDPPGGLYVTSVDSSDLAFDPVALPDATSFLPQGLPLISEAPALQSQPQVSDEGETVATTPSAPVADAEADATEAEVTRLDPDTTLPVPPPSTVEPDAQDTERADQAEDSATPPEGQLPQPTQLAAALTDRAPRTRPSDFVTRIERQKYGGRTRTELARLRPPARPASEQMAALAERASPQAATELAVATAPIPRGRPRDFDAIVAVALVQRQAERVTTSLDYQTPNTNAAIEAALLDDSEPEPRPQQTAPSPQVSIPSSASVARQATIEDAIRLNRVNLVGVYGTSTDRRALVRLPSGRFVKVKVGDRVDGGTVQRITDDELIYLKGRRTVLLSVPKG